MIPFVSFIWVSSHSTKQTRITFKVFTAKSTISPGNDFGGQHNNHKAGTGERGDGHKYYGEEPGSSIKAVANYFHERVVGQYGGPVLDL